mmetsp:Transcript_53789/g.151526  ORF Transcript_53789/g.151526 Transcript_53789/m.151526 type:complete len:219 (+) Transcript_53789:131-787(+)
MGTPSPLSQRGSESDSVRVRKSPGNGRRLTLAAWRGPPGLDRWEEVGATPGRRPLRSKALGRRPQAHFRRLARSTRSWSERGGEGPARSKAASFPRWKLFLWMPFSEADVSRLLFLVRLGAVGSQLSSSSLVRQPRRDRMAEALAAPECGVPGASPSTASMPAVCSAELDFERRLSDEVSCSLSVRCFSAISSRCCLMYVAVHFDSLRIISWNPACFG